MSYRWWLLITALLFVIGLVLGVATPVSTTGPVSGEVDALKTLADFLASLPRPSFLVLIFIKNVSAVLISFILSPIFCLMPILALILNGWLIGFVSVAAVQQKSVIYVIAGLLPHGVFELPALIMGEAVALSFGTAVMLAVFNKDKRSRLLPNLRQNLKYLVVALILFLPAATIETYVTPSFLRWAA